MTTLAVRLTPDAERHVRAGHPWVFDAGVVSVKGEGRAGDLAVVFDRDRRFVGIGLFDPHSPVRIKVLHHGRPVTIDGAFWADRIAAAMARRAPVLAAGDTDGLRLVHGENDGLPGLVLDRYGDFAVLKVYSTAWLPHLDEVAGAIDELLAPTALVVRASRAVRATLGDQWQEGRALLGTAPTEPVTFRERGLTLEADVVGGQKTGYFLDQRENRARVRALAAGARVLDVFCAAGGFGVAAAAGGARSVHGIDQSPAALETARRNMGLNADRAPVRSCVHTVEAADAFDALAALGRGDRRFDIVVIDPPSFAMRADAVRGALRAYGRLTELGLAVLEPGGLFVQSSCSSRVGAQAFFDTIAAAAERAGVGLAPIERTGHPVDHPVGFPQGEYLKTLFARRDRRPPAAAARREPPRRSR